MKKLINEKSILDCNNEKTIEKHDDEIRFLDEFLASTDTISILECTFENYLDSIATEVMYSNSNELMDLIEHNFDYKTGIDYSIVDNDLKVEVYGSNVTADNNPALRKVSILIKCFDKDGHDYPLGTQIQEEYEKKFNPFLSKKEQSSHKKFKYHKKSSEEKKQEINDAFKELQEGVDDLIRSGKYQQVLDSIGKFHEYSAGNSLLIAMQKPTASYVASYSDWKNKFNRQVNKGEKGIQIICPMPKEVELEFPKRDPITKEAIKDSDGNIITEMRKIKYMNYRIGHVYDISQTSQIENKEVIDFEISHELNGKVTNYEELLQAIKDVSPVPISFEEIKSNAYGFYNDNEKKIVVKNNLSQMQTIKTCIHEISHAALHNRENIEKVDDDILRNRHDQEVQAESIAYICARNYGIDTSDYSFGYVLGWSGNPDRINKNLAIIQKTANEIITKIDDSLDKIIEERTNNLGQEDSYFEERSVVFTDKDTALYVQTSSSNEGCYDYTLYKNGKAFDGGIIEAIDKNIDEAINEIVELQQITSPISSTYSFNLFEEVEENHIEIVSNKLQDAVHLATEIDSFMKEYDPYEYADQEQYHGSNFDETFKNVLHISLNDTKKFLESVIDDDRYMAQEAKSLIEKIEKYQRDFEANDKQELEQKNTRKISF